MTAFLLAHLSDPHLAPLPRPRLRDLAGKRALGYQNWTRNRHAVHRRDVLDALVADLQSRHPDHIAITGDLVNLALRSEFGPALAWLQSVGPPHDVTIVPGNHDAYVRGARLLATESWGNYLRGDDVITDSAIAFPFFRRRGPLALIGVSTAVPTAPLMATGRLGRQQLAALDRILPQLGAERAFRVLLIHHPLNSGPNGWHKKLTDAAALIDILRRHGVELILHGHDHRHATMWFDGPHQRIPAIGVPSASAARTHHVPAAYNLFAVARDGNGWRCEQTVRGITASGEFIELKQARLI